MIKTIVTGSPTMFWFCIIVAPSILSNRCTGGAMTSQTPNIILSLQFRIHFSMFGYRVKTVMRSVRIVWSHRRSSHVKCKFRHFQNVAVLIFWRYGRGVFENNLFLVYFASMQFSQLVFLLDNTPETFGRLITSELSALCRIVTPEAQLSVI